MSSTSLPTALESLITILDDQDNAVYQLPLGAALDKVIERLTFNEAAALLLRWIEIHEEAAPFDKELVAVISSKEHYIRAK